ncbi:MAG: hypothetical protein NXI10_05535 [bacterium]|nr:hypothetical protein [bacterium]
MKLITVIISLLLVNFSHSQERSDHLEFSILIVPSEFSDLEFYQLGFNHDLSKRFAVGGSINTWNAQSHAFNLSFNKTEISAGLKWYLFPNNSFFFDPSLHAVYNFASVQPEAIIFRGGGLRAGFNGGYEFNRLGIGAMWQTSAGFGRNTYVGEIEPPSDIGFFWDFFDYGLYFSYKF